MRLFRELLSVTALSFATFAAPGPIHAQQAPAPQPASAKSLDSAPAPVFDVAAIHLHVSEPHEHNSIWSSPFDGRFHAENISVVSLIHWAYEMPETRILGAPAWAAETHFNIDASADPAVDQQLKSMTSDAGRQLKEKMAQELLANRFQLAMHYETRELPIYNLIVAKSGAKLGEIQKSGSSVSSGNGRIDVEMSNSIAVLAEELSTAAGRDVVDKTGISGRYDLKLHWTPDQVAASAADSGPSLFTALEEQLGLKLEPGKDPVRVLVIDRIQKPTEN